MRVLRLAATIAALGLGGIVGLPASGASTSAPLREQADPVIAAAGDIACDPADPNFNGGNGTAGACRQLATAALLGGAAAVLPLGDLQYPDGTLTTFQQSYGPSWGAHVTVTRPVPGNHEYNTPNAAGYFDYFNGEGVNNGRAGERGKGYYSFDVGTWHLVALNSEIAADANSVQVQWLRGDLAATSKPCILAYWHAPRFSSGVHGNDPDSLAFWQELYARGADVVLNGHDHIYERFGLQDPNGAATGQGIRGFVVGTGGKNHTDFPGPIAPNSEMRSSGTYGVLKLTLRSSSYDWQFVPEAGRTFTDTGTTSCHAGPTSVRPSNCRAGFWVADRRRGMRYVCLRRWSL